MQQKLKNRSVGDRIKMILERRAAPTGLLFQLSNDIQLCTEILVKYFVNNVQNILKIIRMYCHLRTRNLTFSIMCGNSSYPLNQFTSFLLLFNLSTSSTFFFMSSALCWPRIVLTTFCIPSIAMETLVMLL